MKYINKSPLNKDFTILPNKMLRDSLLSYKARGILAMILTNREEWEVYQTWIEEGGLEGREAIRGAMNELEGAGYAHYSPKVKVNGRFSGSSWTFYDSPQHSLT